MREGDNILEIVGSSLDIRKDFSFLKSDYSFFEGIDQTIIMSGDDDRFSFFIQFFEKRDDFRCIFWVEISRRLISDDDIRIMDKSSGYCCSLKLSARESFYEFLFFREESYM